MATPFDTPTPTFSINGGLSPSLDLPMLPWALTYTDSWDQVHGTFCGNACNSVGSMVHGKNTKTAWDSIQCGPHSINKLLLSRDVEGVLCSGGFHSGGSCLSLYTRTNFNERI